MVRLDSVCRGLHIRGATGAAAPLLIATLTLADERRAGEGATGGIPNWDSDFPHSKTHEPGWVSSPRHADHSGGSARDQVLGGGAGVRIVRCQLPAKRPWLNPIEPKWARGQRKVIEPARPLPTTDLPNWSSGSMRPYMPTTPPTSPYPTGLPDLNLGQKTYENSGHFADVGPERERYAATVLNCPGVAR
jgi:hypothetical protein